jgi:hypothetical protein
VDYWRERLGDVLDQTTCASTGRGTHFYFRLAEDEVHKGRSSPGGETGAWDLRAEAAGVIAPPSTHTSGRVYRWGQGRGPRALKDAPAELWADAAVTNDKGAGPTSLLSHLLENPPAAEDGAGRNTWLTKVAGHEAHLHKHQDAYIASIRVHGRGVGLDDAEIDKTANSIWDTEQAKQTAVGPWNIDIKKEPREIVEQSLVAIVKANDPPSVFIRDGKLTRHTRDENGAPKLEQMAKAEIRVALERCANFWRRTEDGRQIIKPAPPYTIESLGALGEWPEIPAVEAIIESPVLRRDGTVLDVAGYDAPTRLIYAPSTSLQLGRIPAKPTQKQAAAALKFLADELLSDFPFKTPADEINALALLLTPIIRTLVPLVPIALMDATRAGSGKGLLRSLGVIIVTGRRASVQAAPTREEEWQKVITSKLYAGQTFIFFDEVTTLHSQSLSAAVTAPVWEDRPLGKTANIIMPQRATWVVAGNNLQLKGDLPRRSYRIRLDAEMSRPWTRTGWHHPDLEAWTLEHRAELLTALLTVARAWFAADQPAGVVPQLGSFEPWAESVGGILTYAGAEGFLGNLEAMYDESDTDELEWEGFLVAVRKVFPDTFSTAQLDELIELDKALERALPSDLADKYKRPGFRLSLGLALKKRLDTRTGVDGLSIVKDAADKHNKISQWRVEAEKR